jgi:hypothetical protein
MATDPANDLYREALRLGAAGDLRGAIDRMTRALTLREEALGREHPDLYTWLCVAADMHRDLALQYSDRALDIHEKKTGLKVTVSEWPPRDPDREN